MTSYTLVYMTLIGGELGKEVSLSQSWVKKVNRTAEKSSRFRDRRAPRHSESSGTGPLNAHWTEISHSRSPLDTGDASV